MDRTERRVKILYVLATSTLYGTSKSLLTLLKSLNRETVSPFVVLNSQGPLVSELRKTNTPFKIIPLRRWIIPKRRIGLYTFAYKQAMFGTDAITGVVNRVAFPAYSILGREGRGFEQAYQRTIRVLSLISFPIQFGLLIVAPFYIPLIFSERWSATVPLFQIMVVFGLFRSIGSLGGSALYAAGKPERELRWNIIAMPILMTFVFLGSLFGVFEVALATGVTGSCLAIFFILFVCRSLNWSFWSLLSYLKPAVTCNTIMIVLTAGYVLTITLWFRHPAFVLTTAIIVGALTYVISLRVIFAERLQELVRLAKGKSSQFLSAETKGDS